MIVRSLPLFALAALVAGCPSDTSSVTPADCNLPIVSSALPAAQVQELGQKRVGTVVPFTVAPNTTSFTIVHQAKSANASIVYQGSVLENSAVPAVILMPDGGQWFSDDDSDCATPDGGVPSCGPDPANRLAFFGGGSAGTSAFTVPNTTASLSTPLPAGQWSFVVNDYAYECTNTSGCTDGGTDQNTYAVSVLSKPAAATNLDVAFYIIGSETGSLGKLTAATAVNEPRVTRMVNTFKSIFQGAGVTVRNVTFHDVSADDQQRFGTQIDADDTGVCSALSQMFTLSGANPGNTLNLFLVQSITAKESGGGTVVGIDGTIPGPSTLNGTVHSGAAVSMANLFAGTCISSSMSLGSCGADVVAYIAAHESGHFLGLFHTTESGGDYFDPLTDTGKCPCLTCSTSSDRAKCTQSGGDPILAAGLCTSSSCNGGTNLMFWQLDHTVSQGVLSAQQSQVIKVNPLLQ